MTIGKIFILFLLVAIFGAMVYLSESNKTIVVSQSQSDSKKNDVKNITYIVDGKLIALKNGLSEIPIADSSAKITTSFFSSKNIEDINNDGHHDTLVLLAQESGGSGVFYYAALALGQEEGYYGSNAVFLGDRIKPQSEEYRQGMVVLNYKEHATDQAMTEEPNISKYKYLSWEDNALAELVFSHDLISITSPLPSSEISSPLIVEGEARGYWYFEASFPIVLTDWDGLIIAEGYATAQDEWMTEEFVPFEATLEFDTPEYGDSGYLILQRDNPSDLPENDDAFEIPIIFE